MHEYIYIYAYEILNFQNILAYVYQNVLKV